MTNHQRGCTGHHDLWEVPCEVYARIEWGNKHNPWKCFSPQSVGGYHRFDGKLYDQCRYAGCERTRHQLNSYWGAF